MIRNATPEFNQALDAFVAGIQARSDARYARDYSLVTPPKFTMEPGLKNVRVVTNHTNQRSVFCFVRIADGAVLKAAGWKAPAKHARGSIFVNNGQDAVSDWGANYLR